MILFFENRSGNVIAAGTKADLKKDDIDKLVWLFGDASLLRKSRLEGRFVGPRKEMITPWSTNAVEITQNMGIGGITRIEEFFPVKTDNPGFDPMLQALYVNPGQELFTIDKVPDEIVRIHDISTYNEKEGLALNEDEITYLEGLAKFLDRPLTDSEVFGFSQVNSEHCRHKIFNGIFVIDGEEKDSTLFQLIKNTTHFQQE